MAKKQTAEKFKTAIGGQALIEGIMMLGPDKSAVVVRTKEGLHTKIDERKKPKEGFSLRKLPFIRGIFNFWTSMKIGVSATMYSADFMIDEIEEEKRPDDRLPIMETDRGSFIMSSRDMCAIEIIPELIRAGVNSFKRE